MKNAKKYLALLLSVLLVISMLAACGDNGGSSTPNNPTTSSPNTGNQGGEQQQEQEEKREPITLTVVTNVADTALESRIMDYFAERIGELSDGLISIEPFYAGVLLDDAGMVEGISNGTADIACAGLGKYSGTYGEQTVLALMGIWENEAHYWEACEMEGGLYDYLTQDMISKVGIRCLSFPYTGATQVFLSNKSIIHTLEDMEGQKIRVPNAQMGVAIEASTAVPVLLASSETYNAISTGAVDGCWNGIQTTISRGYPEVVKYITEFKVGYADGHAIFCDEENFQSWPKWVQELVLQVADECYWWSKEEVVAMEQENWAIIENDYENVEEVHHMTEEELAPFFDLIAPSQIELLKSMCTGTAYDDMMEIIESCRPQ